MINTSQSGTSSTFHNVGTAHSRSKRITGKLAHRGLPIIVAILGIPAAAQAEESSCSLHRAAATWNFTDSGTVIGVGPRVAFGKFTLTADGRLLNGVATSSLNGVIAEETFYGTYTVNPDCSGTISIEIFSGDTELLAVSVNILFGDRMQRVNGIFTSVMTPGGVSLSTAIAVEGRRQ